jgi:D-beta-D-heptose 7-phosphate kinase/D-beta-D-heptose 1-phosphate adenosyltransferase
MNRWEPLLERFPQARILVVGDLILDQYIWGEVNRISPEAPIPIVEVIRESFTLGGASNVAHNVRALGAQAEVCGIVGQDGYGKMILDTLREKQIPVHAVVRDPTRPTTLKTRIVAHKQQVVRVDREDARRPDASLVEEIGKRIEERLPHVDAVILEDYGKGVLQDEMLRKVVPLARAAGKLVTVDPKKEHYDCYHGVTAITPNRSEAEAATGIRISDTRSLHEAGERLLNRLECEAVLITMGDQGMCLFQRREPPFGISALAREVYDVSGAGDTVIAVLTTALVAGAAPRQAAVISNVAGGLVVEKLGTATVNREELKRRFREKPL